MDDGILTVRRQSIKDPVIAADRPAGTQDAVEVAIVADDQGVRHGRCAGGVGKGEKRGGGPVGRNLVDDAFAVGSAVLDGTVKQAIRPKNEAGIRSALGRRESVDDVVSDGLPPLETLPG